MTLDELLRTAARDLAEHAPDHDVSPTAVRSRARTVRNRQRAGLVAGLVAVVVLVAVGLQAVVGPRSGPDPVEPPTPSPTPTRGTTVTTNADGSVVTVPEVTADDLREYEVRGTVTNAQPEHLGATDLTLEVTLRDRYAIEWSHFCSGDPDAWFILIVGDTGGAGYGPCNQDEPRVFPALPTYVSPFDHSGGAEATVEVRIFVTGPIPQKHLDCFDRLSPAECQNVKPPLEPLASTDATLGVSVFEYWAPAVVNVLDKPVGARASADGVDYLLAQVVTPGPGRAELATTLPATDHDRLVTVVSRPGKAGVQCLTAASTRQERDACQNMELSIGDRTLLVGRVEVGDIPRLYAGQGFYLMEEGGERQVAVRIPSGDPAMTDFALLVFEQAP
jgi:hypothetical protein